MLLLNGFPASSHMFHNLIPTLADEFRLIASDKPRLACKHPDGVRAFVVQNGTAYDEGIDNDFWKPLKAYWKENAAERQKPLRGFLNRELSGNTRVRDKDATSSDWNVDQPLLDRSGNAEIRLALFHRYGSNASLYPKWQAHIRTHQPPALAVWGENDPIFPARRRRATRGPEDSGVPRDTSRLRRTRRRAGS